jgi:type IV pilus assembly protein PilA
MLRKLRERSQSESGFTLIELLVVILILGILAAIAIPSFLNQREKAQDAQAKSDARTAQTAAETYATDNNGLYTGMTAAGLVSIEQTLSGANSLAVSNVSGNTYTVTVTSRANNNGRTFSITRTAGGQFNRTCAPSGGGCTGGTW